MVKRMNIKDFAEAAGVSTATVSRVFAHDPKVRAKTAERVRALAEQFDFRPNLVAQSAFNGKTKSLGVLLHSLQTSYFADIATGIQQVLLPKDYLPIIVSLRQGQDFVALRRLVDHRVDGIIAAVGEQDFSETELREINRFQLPVVTIDAFGQFMSSDNVSSDESACGALAAEFFAGKGHSAFYFFASNPKPEKLMRYQAYREKLLELGFAEPVILLEKEYSDRKLAEALRNCKTPCACYCFNDNDAAALYRAASLAGLRIPEEISVIGTADLNIASTMSPGLTTIRQDGVEIGRLAAELILEKLNSDHITYTKRISSVELIERESVANLNKNRRRK